MSNKQKIIGVVIAIGLLLIGIFKFGLGGGATPRPSDVSQSDSIELTSTSPSQLKAKQDVTILPTQALTFTFNQPLQNVPETRYTIEPKADVKLQLSDDRKTLTITPNTPYSLGQGYTLFIKGGTKFDNNKTLGSDQDFHFSTINYTGV